MFGWTADEQASFKVLDTFVAGGSNFIDDADGLRIGPPATPEPSEAITGRWMASRRNRNQVLIATKVGARWALGG